jgi:hypothetical protein
VDDEMNVVTSVSGKGDTTRRRWARFIRKLCIEDVSRTT